MENNFCPSPRDLEYSASQIETGIYQIEFDNPKDNPWPDYKYFVRVGGGYRGFSKKTDARKYYRAD